MKCNEEVVFKYKLGDVVRATKAYKATAIGPFQKFEGAVGTVVDLEVFGGGSRNPTPTYYVEFCCGEVDFIEEDYLEGVSV